MRGLRLLTIGLLAAAALGCTKDGYSELGLVPVAGKITLDGKPLANAKVVFEGDDTRSAIGTTDASGQYKVMYDSQTAGATPGAKIVRITTADVGEEGGGASEGATVAKESVPARYNVQSELKADVSAGKKTYDFELKSSP
jgi:hypothetical protein